MVSHEEMQNYVDREIETLKKKIEMIDKLLEKIMEGMKLQNKINQSSRHIHNLTLREG